MPADDELGAIDAWWRAANYLSAGQIYLHANPLLRRLLDREGIKRGCWAIGAPSPGANPMNGRDHHGMVSAALSVAKIPYDQARDDISLTETVTPACLGRTPDDRPACACTPPTPGPALVPPAPKQPL